MAFINKPSIVSHTVAGGTVFPFEFKWFSKTDIKVYHVGQGETANDANDILSTADYIITFNSSKVGGDVTINIPISDGDTITIQRLLPVTRDIDYTTRGNFEANTVNDDQDYQTYLLLDSEALSTSFLRSPISGGDPVTFPPSEPLAFIWWDENGVLGNNIALPDAISSAQASAWEAEAEKLTADSYATQLEDVFVNVYTSNGDGTFTSTPTTDYSSLHWATKSAETGRPAPAVNDLTDVTTTNPQAGESLVVNPNPTSGNDIWINGKVLGLPNETNQAGKTVSNQGVEGDSTWRNVVSNPTNVKEDETLIANGMMVSPTIDDGKTITVPNGQVLVIL